MWSRLRTKVLTKTSAYDITDCSDLEFDLGCHVDDLKHVTGDVTMALVDKCSCGSPSRTTGSRRGDGMTSLNRKLEPPVSKSSKNEYTRTTADNRKKMTSSTNAGHARKEEVNNAKNALHQIHQQHRLASNAVTSYHNKLQHDSDGDSDVDMANRKWMNRKWGEDETGSSSNYTALNYDVNYVRVSPPKMTRRLKPQSETDMKMTREAQLAASRAAQSRGEAGTQPLQTRHDNTSKTPPVKPRTTLARRGEPDVTKNTLETPISAEVDLQEPREAGTSSKEMKPASSESDYIALSDLQASLAQSMKPKVDKLTGETEAVSVPEVDDSKTVTAKMFNDGENSFLQFTFTVKLDNSTVKNGGKSTPDVNSPAPVVSGTVNIVKSAQPEGESTGTQKDATVTMKPVVSVQGGVMIGREDKPETHASSAGTKLSKKPIGIAGIQLTQDDSRRHVEAENGSRPSSAGTQQSVHDQQQPRSGRRSDAVTETITKLETSESFYHSLLQRDVNDDDESSAHYEGVDQSENTHMSWDEVMREAKSLGIPLRQPGTGRPSERRRSVSQLNSDPAENCNVWSCSNCQRTVIEPPRPTFKTPATAPVLQKTASPFKDMFRMANIFGRKAKDDPRSKVVSKQTLTLPRGQSCDVCGEPEVTSSPSARRQGGVSGAAAGRNKYKRSSSTPRPAGDNRLQVHPGDSSRPALRQRVQHSQHVDC